MKSFLKWGAIAIAALVGLLLISELSIETQRWIVLGAFLGWGLHSILTAIEKARVDLAERLARIEHFLYQQKNQP